ncbi:MAG: hypothetical protein ACI9EW_003047 [Cellvibrionaceae bacterium]|jgi:uncharacterized protein (DUF58 family)
MSKTTYDPAMSGTMPQTRVIIWKNRWSIVPLGILIVLAILLPNAIWTVLLITLGGLYGISYFWARALHQHLHGERFLQQSWISVGDFLTERFFIHNRSPFPALWVELTDFSNIPGYRPSVAYEVGGRSTYKWRQSAMCWQRGRFVVGPWRLRSGDPFGIFEVQIDYAESDEMIIHPPINTELKFSLPTGLQQGNIRGRDRAIQVTNNISTVREYQPMDPLNWIHWPTTARTGKLAVREFDIEAAGDAWILIDLESTWHTGNGLESTEEYAVLLASALTARVLAENRAVGLATYGPQPIVIPSHTGAQQQWRILRALAVLTANGETSLDTALDDAEQVIGRGAALIIITANDDPTWLPKLVQLSRKQIKTTVLLLDRSSFKPHAEKTTSQAKSVQKMLQQMGHVVHLIQQGDIDLSHSTPQPSDQFKITPLGGAVRVQT